VRLDVADFERLSADGREQLRRRQYGEAAATLGRALGLFRGAPYAEAADIAWAQPEITRLEDLQREAIGDWCEALIGCGRAAEAIGPLESITRGHPMRERFVGLLMRAYAAAGRTADALTLYERARRALAESLGSDPSRELQDLHLEVLRQEQDPTQDGTASLPAPLTSFVGREREIARVEELVESSRLVTIIGPGGAGKTRTSFEVGRRLAAHGARVRLVELAKTTDGENIEQVFLRDLGLARASRVHTLEERAGLDGRALLIDALTDEEWTLVVDNCEHVIGPVAELIAGLLARCPRLRIIATSREALAIDGEALCALSSLPLPEAGGDVDTAAESPAVRLFVDRARAASASFAADAASMPAIVQIVRRLDGLPLAIELAAARLRVLPIDAVAQGLDDRFGLLGGGRRTGMSRHRTLQAVVDWSWALLTPEERHVLEWLSIYPGGFTARTAAKVCRDASVTEREVPEILNSLVDKSLLIVVGGDTTRYRMLETIREYGAARLVESGVVQAARARLARHFLVFAERIARSADEGDQAALMRRFNDEYDNLVAAMTFYVENRDSDRAIALCLHLMWFWMVLGMDEELSRWMRLAAEIPVDTPGVNWYIARGIVLFSQMAAQFAATDTVDMGRDRTVLLAESEETAAALRRYVDDGPIEAALALMMLLFFRQEFAEADRVADDAVRRATPLERGRIRLMRAAFAENFGDLDALRVNAELALADLDTTNDQWGRSQAIVSRAYLRALDGDIAGAIADTEEARAISRRLGATDDQIYVGARQIGLLVADGRIEEAGRLLDELEILLGRSRGGQTRDMLVAVQRLLVEDARGNADGLKAALHDVRSMLDGPRVPSGQANHVIAIGASAISVIELESGALKEGFDDLTRAFAAGRELDDQPWVAGIGVGTALLAGTLGDYAAAAEILGACEGLRGSADPSNVRETRMYAEARDRLGDEFDSHHRAGKALSKADAIDRLDPVHFADLVSRRTGTEA